MVAVVELRVDVTAAAAVGQACETAVTVFLPDPEAVADLPVVCFAFPGGGYSRRYYSFAMPGDADHGEVGFHVDRGWIVVTVDHIGVGDSTLPDPGLLTLDNIAAADVATATVIMDKLVTGTLSEGFPAINGAVKLAIGQSMGGMLLLVAQGQHAAYDGVGILGCSAIQNVVRSNTPPLPIAMPWILRSSDMANPIIIKRAEVAGEAHLSSEEAFNQSYGGQHPMQYAWHFEDEPADIVAQDMVLGGGAPWQSATFPPCGNLTVSPGVVAAEAAAISVPVLIAVGERDVVPDPWMEAKAYKSATDLTVYICPRMAHMHNFATTRHQFWERIQVWGDSVAAIRHFGAPTL